MEHQKTRHDVQMQNMSSQFATLAPKVAKQTTARESGANVVAAPSRIYNKDKSKWRWVGANENGWLTVDGEEGERVGIVRWNAHMQCITIISARLSG